MMIRGIVGAGYRSARFLRCASIVGAMGQRFTERACRDIALVYGEEEDGGCLPYALNYLKSGNFARADWAASGLEA